MQEISFVVEQLQLPLVPFVVLSFSFQVDLLHLEEEAHHESLKAHENGPKQRKWPVQEKFHRLGKKEQVAEVGGFWKAEGRGRVRIHTRFGILKEI